MTPRHDEVESPEPEAGGGEPEKPEEGSERSEVAPEEPELGSDRPEPAAETPAPDPETPQSPSGEGVSEPPTSRETEPEDPARPVIDDPDTGELATPAATDPGRTTSDSTVACPFCGEPTELYLEPTGEAGRQEFVEECEACGRDFEVDVEYDDAGVPHIHTDRTQ